MTYLINYFQSKSRENIKNLTKINSNLARIFLAETFGMIIFLSFSLASVAQFIFTEKMSFLSANISFGFGLTIAIIVCGKVSGETKKKNINYNI